MRREAVGYVVLTIAVFLWAGNAVIGRTAPDVDVPPIALNFWRWAVALVMLAPFAIPRLVADWPLFRSYWWLWVVFGIVTVTGFNSAYYIGLRHTTVVQGTLISSLLPIIVLVAARFVFGQPITVRQIMGIALSMTGVALIVLRGDLSVLDGFSLNIGDAWILLAVMMWAAQIILIRFVPKGMSLIGFQVLAFVPGLITLLPFYVHETMSGQPMPLTVPAMLYVAYAGILASVIGFTFWNMGAMRIGSNAGYFGNLFPIFGAFLGIVLLGEQLHWFHAVGGLVTLAGIYLATVTPAKSGQPG